MPAVFFIHDPPVIDGEGIRPRLEEVQTKGLPDEEALAKEVRPPWSGIAKKGRSGRRALQEGRRLRDTVGRRYSESLVIRHQPWGMPFVSNRGVFGRCSKACAYRLPALRARLLLGDEDSPATYTFAPEGESAQRTGPVGILRAISTANRSL